MLACDLQSEHGRRATAYRGASAREQVDRPRCCSCRAPFVPGRFALSLYRLELHRSVYSRGAPSNTRGAYSPAAWQAAPRANERGPFPVWFLGVRQVRTRERSGDLDLPHLVPCTAQAGWKRNTERVLQVLRRPPGAIPRAACHPSCYRQLGVSSKTPEDSQRAQTRESRARRRERC